MSKEQYVKEMLSEMKEQFDIGKEEEKDLKKAIEQEYDNQEGK